VRRRTATLRGGGSFIGGGGRVLLRHACLPLLALSLLPGQAPAEPVHGTEVPVHHAEDPGAAVVTEASLLANEQFWPYQTELVREWEPGAGGRPLPRGTVGVLIRMEATGTARIDFGREGLYEVPIGATDLVERANRVRLGELEKMAPNFVLAIGPRMVDSTSAAPAGLDFRAVTGRPGFLCVFADPDGEGFDALAAALAPLRDRHRVMTILFPQGGERPDPWVWARLRKLGWTVPFLFDHLAEPYTRTLLDEPTPLPALLLVTSEGRVLYRARWKAGVEAEVGAALERGFGDSGAATTAPAGGTGAKR
jgi:hypothetical protein